MGLGSIYVCRGGGSAARLVFAGNLVSGTADACQSETRPAQLRSAGETGLVHGGCLPGEGCPAQFISAGGMGVSGLVVVYEEDGSRAS